MCVVGRCQRSIYQTFRYYRRIYPEFSQNALAMHSNHESALFEQLLGWPIVSGVRMLIQGCDKIRTRFSNKNT